MSNLWRPESPFWREGVTNPSFWHPLLVVVVFAVVFGVVTYPDPANGNPLFQVHEVHLGPVATLRNTAVVGNNGG